MAAFPARQRQLFNEAERDSKDKVVEFAASVAGSLRVSLCGFTRHALLFATLLLSVTININAT